MATIVDYASLKQAILDWSHRADLASFVDYFIQAAQSQIETDIPDENFGNYIAPQEAAYGPFVMQNGVTPVPTDWLGAKVLWALNTQGYQQTLIMKSASWMYDAAGYPARVATGFPATVARDTWQTVYSAPQNYPATANQTVFTLSSTPPTSGLILVTLDGASLTQGVSYTLSGNTLTLTTGATAGQVLGVQYLGASSAGSQDWTAMGGQTSFAMNNASLSVIAATLDGAILVAGTDYTVSGGFIKLTTAAASGQTLTAYYDAGSVLIFGPYPDSAYTVGGTYYQKAPLLSSTQTTNWMVLNAPTVLLDACMREAARFLKDAGMFQLWDTEYQRNLKSLVDADKAERWSAGTLQVDVG